MGCGIMRVQGALTPLPYQLTLIGKPVTKPIISQETLRELLRYDPETGIFTWRNRSTRWFNNENSRKAWNNRHQGKTTGCHNGQGYLVIGVFYHLYRAHRLACLYMTGRFPEEEMDHINGIRDDNRWGNLRPVTRKENCKNMSMRSDNTSGVVGVRWNRDLKKWRAEIRIDGKTRHIGVFTDKAAATLARKATEADLGFHKNHGKTLDAHY